MAIDALKPGMALYDVLVVMLNVRLPQQYSSLDSGRTCRDASVDIVIHAGELVAKVGRTRVYAAGFASIHSVGGQAFKSEGFERQGTLLEVVRARQRELMVCPDVLMTFDATVEGGCGRDTISLTFDGAGSLKSIGQALPAECVP